MKKGLLYFLISICLLVILVIVFIRISRCKFFKERFKKPNVYGSPFNTKIHTLKSRKFVGVPEKVYTPKQLVGLPEHLDCRMKWPTCIGKIRNQGQCGSCWAFVTAEVLGDRYCTISCGILQDKDVIKPNELCGYKHVSIGKTGKLDGEKFLKKYKEFVGKNKKSSPFFKNFSYIPKKMKSNPNLLIINNDTIDFLGELAHTPWLQTREGGGGGLKNPEDWVPPVNTISDADWFEIMDFDKDHIISWPQYRDWKMYFGKTEQRAYEDWLRMVAPVLNFLGKDAKNIYKGKTGAIIGLNFDITIKQLNNPKFPLHNLSFTDFILSKVPGPLELSPTQLVLCNSKNLDKATPEEVCQGNSIAAAWKYLVDYSITTDDCIGYVLEEGNDINPKIFENLKKIIKNICKTSVLDLFGTPCFGYEKTGGQIFNSFGAKIYYHIPGVVKNNSKEIWKEHEKNRIPTHSNIMKEISEYGPVSTGMYISASFMGWSGGQKFKEGKDNPLGNSVNSLIWDEKVKKEDKEKDFVTGHAIKIIGWGVYEDKYHKNEKTGIVGRKIPYWICANSWGYKWGTTGDNQGPDTRPEDLQSNKTGEQLDWITRKKFRYGGLSTEVRDTPYGLPSYRNGGGCFWILRGENVGFLENNVVVGYPDVGQFLPETEMIHSKQEEKVFETHFKKYSQSNLGDNNVKKYRKILSNYDKGYSLYYPEFAKYEDAGEGAGGNEGEGVPGWAGVDEGAKEG
jgi:hypothetical protein